MSVRGRKPKPTHLKLVAGNPGRRELNEDEPIPEGDLDAPPDWLTERQQESWRYAIANAPTGLLKRLDRSVLTAFVIAEDMHRDASQMIAKYGAVVKAPGTGVPMQSPYVSILNKQAVIMMRASSEMGFTPSSRSRVKVPGKGNGKNKFGDLKDLPVD
jgi:P27 family predicted phage terminase small subunit